MELKNINLSFEVKRMKPNLYGLTKEEGERLASFYGTNVDTIFSFAHALKRSR